MGRPGGSDVPSPANESIVCEEGTRGTETSKYPEEKKERSISTVAASEEERGQTGGLRTTGVEGRRYLKIADLKLLERGTEEGERPVREGDNR